MVGTRGRLIALLVIVCVASSCASLDSGNEAQPRMLWRARLLELVRVRAAISEYAQAEGRYPDDLLALEHAGLLAPGSTEGLRVEYRAGGSSYEEDRRADLLLFEESHDRSHATAGSGHFLLYGEGRPEWLPSLDEQRESLLFDAALNGWTELARLLVARGVDVNAQEEGGRTPLDYASNGGHVDMVKMLLAQGANLEARTPDGFTPLDVAAMSDHEECAEFLIAEGASVGVFAASGLGRVDDLVRLVTTEPALVEAIDSVGNTPLHHAAAHGRKNAVELLLARGAKVGLGNAYGDTPLHLAATAPRNRDETIELLKASGAEPDIFTAVALGDVPFCERALKGKPTLVDQRTPNQEFTPLHVAAYFGQKDVAALLLAAGAKVGALAAGDSTPLGVAAGRGHQALVQLLLENGADVNTSGMGGQTPLHSAAAKGHTDVVQTLIAAGGDVNAKRPNGWTPLHLAVLNGAEDTVELLLSAGASPGATDELLGRTPLHYAPSSGGDGMVRLLVEAGAPVNARDTAGWTALGLAELHGNGAAVGFLRDHGAEE